MHYGLARHFGANVDKHLEEKENMDDQVNIKFINMKEEIAMLRAWIEQVSKSEALHAERVISMSLEISKLQKQVQCLEECEDLRDQQLAVLKKFIDTYLMLNITSDGKHHDKDNKVNVLTPPAKKR